VQIWKKIATIYSHSDIHKTHQTQSNHYYKVREIK